MDLKTFCRVFWGNQEIIIFGTYLNSIRLNNDKYGLRRSDYEKAEDRSIAGFTSRTGGMQ